MEKVAIDKISREIDTENDTAKVKDKARKAKARIKAKARKAKAKTKENDIDNPNVWTLQDYFYAFDEPVEGTVRYIISFSKSIKGVEKPHRFRIEEESSTLVENENENDSGESGLEWNRCDSFFAFPGRGRSDQGEQTSDDVGETKN